MTHRPSDDRASRRAVREAARRLVGSFVLAVLLVAVPARAEGPSRPEGRSAFKSYGAPQGLTNALVWSIAQDEEGFLWVGTEGGLFRYDGSRFQVFRTADGLPSEWIRTVLPAPGGRLWVGTLRGLAYRDRGRFVAVGAERGIPEAEVFALVREPGGRIWVGTHHGLFREAGEGRFEPAPGWPSHAMARALCLDGAHLLVASGTELHRLPLAGGPGERLASLGERVDGLGRDSAGRVWIRGRNKLWMRSAEGAPLADLSARAGPPVVFDAQVHVDAAGTVWMPSSEGVLRIRGEAWEQLGEARGLPTLWVNRVFVDREGSLWIGGSGLYRILGRGLWTQFTHKDGVPGGVLRSLVRDRAGRLWGGTPRGLYRFEAGGWRLVERTKGQVVLALAEAPDGALWIGAGGTPPLLHRWEVDADRWTDLSAPSTTIAGLHVDAGGVAWVASRREGLWRVADEGRGFVAARVALPQGVEDERIQSVVSGADGRVWAAGAEGLALLEGGGWRRFGTADGLEHKHVMGVVERPGAEVWVSYLEPYGISRFRWAGGRLEKLGTMTVADGLASNQISSFLEDARGRLWLASSLGVHLFDGGRLEPFGMAEGLPGDDSFTLLAERGGEVWVGTSSGAARFDAAAHAGPPLPPPVHLLSVRAGERALAGPPPASLTVAHAESTLELRFSALTFAGEAAVRHQVRMAGLEDAWRETDVRQARYAALPPGRYRFEVRAGLGAGSWGPAAGIDLVVLPAWWQHWLFRLAVVLLGMAVVGLAAGLRVRALHRRNGELQALVTERTEQLEVNARLLKEAQETVVELERAIAAISSASARQVAGASEQSSAIAQTATSVQEINAIAEQSSARAHEVAESLQRTEAISREGRDAVAQAIGGMGQLRESIGAIGLTLADLSEHVQRVREIIDTVNDLAERSNLLALNASIEAAIAGEAGRGFVVVAREVRRLAEQSRQATGPVRQILTEIMKSARRAVQATDDGSAMAQEKARTAEQAGVAIGKLAEVIERSASEAGALALAGREQAASIEQIALAMRSINETTAVSLEGTHQAEQAARELAQLARKLAATVERYRT